MQGLTADADIVKTMNDKDRSFSVNAKLTRGDGSLSYVSTDSSVAEISGSDVIVRGTGKCKIIVTASETDKYSETQRHIQLKIEKGTQKFVIPQMTYSKYTTDKDFYVKASVEAPADGKVTFTANDNDIFTVSENGLVKLTGKAGSAKLFATASGTKSFEYEVSEGITIKVAKKPAAKVTRPAKGSISSRQGRQEEIHSKVEKTEERDRLPGEVFTVQEHEKITHCHSEELISVVKDCDQAQGKEELLRAGACIQESLRQDVLRHMEHS